jgi:hypothetical protein
MRCYGCNRVMTLFGRENSVLTVNNEDFAFGHFACVRRCLEGILGRAESRHADSVIDRAQTQARLAMAALRRGISEGEGADPPSETGGKR